MNHTMFPRVRRLRSGYQCAQVETFLARVEGALTGAQPQVSAADVRRVGFELVRHGYVLADVDAHLDELEERLLAMQSPSGGGRRARNDPNSDLLFLRDELVAPYMRRFPRTRTWRRGYLLDDVDDFLDRVAATLSGADDDPVTVDDVRRMAFRPKRGGYEERAVDETLDRVVEMMLLIEAGARH
jgi:DivIVA domain-containing protein